MVAEVLGYSDVKQQILDAYYDGCIGVGLIRARPHEEVVGWVLYNFEDVFERPVERLMQHVVGLVLVANWYPVAALKIREEIESILSNFELDALLAELSAEDGNMLQHDLKLLKLIA